MSGAGAQSPGCIPRPFRRRNPAESHLSISSRQGFWRRNLVHYALAAVGGASDHKFSKYDGMKAVSFLHSFVLCPVFGLITGICYYPVFFLTFINTTKLALAANPAMPTSLAEISGGEKKWNAPWHRALGFHHFIGALFGTQTFNFPYLRC